MLVLNIYTYKTGVFHCIKYVIMCVCVCVCECVSVLLQL